MEVTEPTFNRPIPGEGLTHELGARPWQNPPQFSLWMKLFRIT